MAGRDISKTLAWLQDKDTILTETLLYTLSDLDRSGREAFRAAWPKLDPMRKKELMKALVDLAEKNIEVDFNFIMRLALNDPDDEVRAIAITGLWEDESPSLVGPLLRLLTEDRSERVRAEAAAALGQFVLLGELGRLEEALAFGVQEALLRAYNTTTESVEVRRRALESLAFSGDEAIRDLIEAAYTDIDDRMVASAIFSMGRSADAYWKSTVIRELENSNPEIRFEAARAAGELESVEAVHLLGELAMNDADEQVRAMSIRALGQIGGKEARRILETLEETEENEALQDTISEALDELLFLEDALTIPHFYDLRREAWHTEEDDSDEAFDDPHANDVDDFTYEENTGEDEG